MRYQHSIKDQILNEIKTKLTKTPQKNLDDT